MQQDPEILALQRRVESLERILRSGVAINQTKNKTTIIAEDDPDIVDPPTNADVPGTEGDMYMFYKA